MESMHAPFAKSSRIFSQHSKPRQRPVHNPRAAGIHGDEALGIILEGIIEEAGVDITLQGGDAMLVEVLLGAVDAFQEW